MCVGGGGRGDAVMLPSPRTDMVRRKERFVLSDLGIFQRAGINPAYARVQLSEGCCRAEY